MALPRHQMVRLMHVSPSRIWLLALGTLLLGYALFDKGFAYLRLGPAYIGDAALGFGLLCLFASGIGSLTRLPLVWPLLLFMGWGALRTLPCLDAYGAEALRDAVIWGYAAFALLAGAMLLRSGWFSIISRAFGWVMPIFLLLEPVLILVFRATSGKLDDIGPSNIGYLDIKAGDAAVHYGGIAAFLLLEVAPIGRPAAGLGRAREYLLWLFWSGGALLVSAFSRGGLLAIAAAMLAASSLNPRRSRVTRPVLLASALALCLLPLGQAVDPEGERVLSPQQVAANAWSILDSNSRTSLDGTRLWRLEWWNDIIGYTLFGDYFWTGKGFGINLADADGFQVTEDGSLRSPHNGHLTILARMGVPGLLIWTALQAAFCGSLLRALARARRRGDEAWIRLNAWILAYWLAFILNGAFDVFLEGPQGGIWFWCIVGFGMAALAVQREAEKHVAVRAAVSA